MRIAFWNSCLDVCFLNFWLLKTDLDFKTTKKNMFTIVLRLSSETSAMWKNKPVIFTHPGPWICDLFTEGAALGE